MKDQTEDQTQPVEEVVTMKHQFSIENFEMPTDILYPKLEWLEGDAVKPFKDAVIFRGRNHRVVIVEATDSQGNECYRMITLTLEPYDVPNIVDHPLFYVEKVRATKWGNLYHM